MIHELLPIIAEELNDYFRRKFDDAEDKVVVSSIVEQNGDISIQGENKVILQLVNIEREGKTNHGSPHFRHASGLTGRMNPPVHVNIYIVFAAYFNSRNYAEALKFISGIIGFFQAKNVFDHSEVPLLNEGIDKLVFEIVSLDLREMSNLWAAIGAKYLPSCVYKIRTLNMQEDLIRDEIPVVANIN